jgi:hypothetical protein
MTTNNEEEQPLAPPPPPEPAANATAPAPNASAPPATAICANCGTELLGVTCYRCGQPVKGMVRHLSSILADVADTVLNIDSRIFRTLKPLLLRPGYLTNEYLAGRRVRYVTPFRLYFFLSVIAFLVMQVSLDATLDLSKGPVVIDSGTNAITAAQTAEEVQARRDAQLAALEQAKLAASVSNHARKGIDKAEEQVHAQAEKRLQYLQRLAAAKANGTPAPPDPDAGKDKDDFNFEVDGKHWDPKTDPIKIAWLPGFVNARFNTLAQRGLDNLPRIKKDPKPFMIGAFGLLPQVLFLLMPLFALLLKIFYIFKRRLYMEHLIVALHSHSFIFLSVLLLTLAGLLRSWAATAAPWLGVLLGWVMFALGWWLPLYLLIMQKRVYRQGWFFTVVKYLSIGLCYTIMVSIGVAVAFVISLATT